MTTQEQEQLELPLDKKGFEFDEQQIKAISLCLDTTLRMVAVSGPAGTGKTSIMRVAYDKLVDAGHNVVLCAPTGKAAKRIHEATGIPAMTIHRLLEYPHPGERDEKTGKPLRTTDPKRFRGNPIEYNIVLCDEYAMVNTLVHRNLVDALPPGGCIRCFGDINQLQPIESGSHARGKPSPFREILDKFKSVELETIHRQGEGSGIVHNGQKILQGRVPKRLDDFALFVTDVPTERLDELIYDGSLDPSRLDHQVIVLQNKDWVGAYKLSVWLQKRIWNDRKSDHPWLDVPRNKWAENQPIRIRPGDKVIWTQNDYDLVIFNGETGIVEDTNEFGEIDINFGDRVVTVPPSKQVETRSGTLVEVDPRMNIDLAYAITTHKSQGSEYMVVAYVMNKSNQAMQCRPNFYTAVTRARERVYVVSDLRSLQGSVNKKKTRFD